MPQLHARRLANFYVIGAAKCGTTTLARYLARHPDLFVTKPKEPEFFAQKSPTAADWDRYTSLFTGAGNRLAGEASTIYTRYPHFGGVPKRIAATTPDAKLIYLVREPVYRAHADCATIQRFWFNTGRARAFDLSVEDALQHHDPLMKSILDAGRYHYQISQYLEVFPRENLMVISMDQLVASPREILESVFAFLGVRSLGQDGLGADVAANRRTDFHAKVARYRAVRLLESVPLAQVLRPMIPAWVKERVYALLSRRVSTEDISLPPMTQETFSRLMSFYREDTEQLGAEFGIDVSGWRALAYADYVSRC